MTANAWPRIKAALETRGIIAPGRDHGVRREVKASTCRHCHAPVLTGLDADLLARPCTVDPAPLDQLGEALALIAGRYTVTLHRTADRFELDWRSEWHIAGSLASTKPVDVLAEHVCGAPPLPAAPSAYQPKQRHLEDTCPF